MLSGSRFSQKHAFSSSFLMKQKREYTSHTPEASNQKHTLRKNKKN